MKNMKFDISELSKIMVDYVPDKIWIIAQLPKFNREKDGKFEDFINDAKKNVTHFFGRHFEETYFHITLNSYSICSFDNCIVFIEGLIATTNESIMKLIRMLYNKKDKFNACFKEKFPNGNCSDFWNGLMTYFISNMDAVSSDEWSEYWGLVIKFLMDEED